MSEIVTDNFTRADAANLGANWTLVTGLTNFTILTNKGGTSATNATFGGRFTGAGWTGGNDHYVEVTVTANLSGSDGGPACRIQSGADSGYMFDINFADTVALGSSQTIETYSVSGGVPSLILAGTNMVIAANDVLRLEANGNQIGALVNGVQKVTATTNSAFSSGSPGIRWFQGASVNHGTEFSLFAAGDFAAAVVVVIPPPVGFDLAPQQRV